MHEYFSMFFRRDARCLRWRHAFSTICAMPIRADVTLFATDFDFSLRLILSLISFASLISLLPMPCHAILRFHYFLIFSPLALMLSILLMILPLLLTMLLLLRFSYAIFSIRYAFFAYACVIMPCFFIAAAIAYAASFFIFIAAYWLIPFMLFAAFIFFALIIIFFLIFSYDNIFFDAIFCHFRCFISFLWFSPIYAWLYLACRLMMRATRRCAIYAADARARSARWAAMRRWDVLLARLCYADRCWYHAAFATTLDTFDVSALIFDFADFAAKISRDDDAMMMLALYCARGSFLSPLRAITPTPFHAISWCRLYAAFHAADADWCCQDGWLRYDAFSFRAITMLWYT